MRHFQKRQQQRLRNNVEKWSQKHFFVASSYENPLKTIVKKSLKPWGKIYPEGESKCPSLFSSALFCVLRFCSLKGKAVKEAYKVE